MFLWPGSTPEDLSWAIWDCFTIGVPPEDIRVMSSWDFAWVHVFVNWFAAIGCCLGATGFQPNLEIVGKRSTVAWSSSAIITCSNLSARDELLGLVNSSFAFSRCQIANIVFVFFYHV